MVFAENWVQPLKLRKYLAKMNKEEQACEWVLEYGKWLVCGVFILFALC